MYIKEITAFQICLNCYFQVNIFENFTKSDDKIFPCKLCGKKFVRKAAAKKHIRSIHEAVEYPCDQCYYKASQQGHLKIHIESVHEGIKKFFCNHCDFKSSQKKES